MISVIELWCEECKSIKKDNEQLVHNFGIYCKTCYENRKSSKLYPKEEEKKRVSVDAVGLNWQLDTIRGRALDILKKNETALNSDEALFSLYLERFDKNLIIKKPSGYEIAKILEHPIRLGNIDLTEGEIKEARLLAILNYIDSLRVDWQELTSFQTLRLARQELKREAKRKGMMQIFDPIVEQKRREREEIVKERYRREL